MNSTLSSIEMSEAKRTMNTCGCLQGFLVAHGRKHLHKDANTGKANWIGRETKNFEVVAFQFKEIPQIRVFLKIFSLKNINTIQPQFYNIHLKSKERQILFIN